MAKDIAVRMELTAKLLRGITFERRLTGGVGPDGNPLVETTKHGVNDWIVRDAVVKGLGIRVYPGKDGKNAQISYFVQRKMSNRIDGSIGSKSMPVRRVIDHYPNLKLEDARKRAQIWIGMMAEGRDPAQAKATALRERSARDAEVRNVFGRVYESFMSNSSGVSDSTKLDRKKLIKWMEGSPLWRTPLNDLSVEIVEKTFVPMFDFASGDAGKPAWGPKKPDLSTMWKCFRYCASAFSNIVARTGGGKFARGSSPFAIAAQDKGWKLPPPKTTALDASKSQDQEWLRGLVALRSNPAPQVRVMADYLLCALIWGGRRREIQMIRWKDIDFTTLTGQFVAENTKAKKLHQFPITPWVAQILVGRKEQNKAWDRDEEWVFPSRHRGKHLVDHRGLLEELHAETGLWLTAHDLRRTAASDTAMLTTSDSLMVSMTLAHSGGMRATTQNYIAMRVQLLRPLFEARERKFQRLAGLSPEEPMAGPIEALIEFLLAAKQNPLAVEQISKKAESVLGLLAS